MSLFWAAVAYCAYRSHTTMQRYVFLQVLYFVFFCQLIALGYFHVIYFFK